MVNTIFLLFYLNEAEHRIKQRGCSVMNGKQFYPQARRKPTQYPTLNCESHHVDGDIIFQ